MRIMFLGYSYWALHLIIHSAQSASEYENYRKIQKYVQYNSQY